MNVALIVLATLLGIAAAASALRKLRRDPRTVESMHAVGVTDRQIPLLAVLEILGAVGLLVGIWLVPVGIAAAAGLALYFLGAVVSHIRRRIPLKDTLPAIVLTIIALATLALEVSR